MTDYTIKDSGKRRVFDTGAQRDRGDIKPRPDLLHPYFLYRFGLHMAKGAEKYNDWNWAKGMPLSDWYASLYRHVILDMVNDQSEDHKSAICFNAMGAMVTEAGIKAGIYPKELDDRFKLDQWVPLMQELTLLAQEARVPDQCSSGYQREGNRQEDSEKLDCSPIPDPEISEPHCFDCLYRHMPKSEDPCLKCFPTVERTRWKSRWQTYFREE